MSFRLRKSFSPIPGVRITLSPRGVSTSIGAGPLRFTVGPQGSAVTTRIPGSGISYRHRLDSGVRRSPSLSNEGGAPLAFLGNNPPPTPALPQYDYSAHRMDEIASEGTGMLTTPGLRDLLGIMQKSKQQNAEIQQELENAQKQQSNLRRKVTRWSDGVFLKKLRKQTFARMKEEAAEADVAVDELKEMQRQSSLQVDIDAPTPVLSAFHKMCDQFTVMSQSKMIWDTTMARAANKYAERTSAARIVTREPIKFRLSKCPLMDSTMRVPHLENANGGDIYIYPNFAVYFHSEDAFALLEISTLQLAVTPTTFIEEDSVPEDSTITGQTWNKVNKDGSPDRRFANNYQIPVALYGKISIRSDTGMNEEYLVSNAGSTLAFFDAWQHFARSVASVTSDK